MTHIKTAQVAGTGNPWLDNGNPSTRKSACVDCHNIAETAVGDALAGVTGYKPDYTGVGNFVSPTVYNEVIVGNGGADDVYLCVKCHGGPASAAGTLVDKKLVDSWIGTARSNGTGANVGGNNANGWSATYYRGDIAREFNPANASGHRVFPDADGVFRGEVKTEWFNVPTVPSNAVGKIGTNANTVIEPKLQLPIRSLTSWFKTDIDGKAWAYNSQMTCTDCHTALNSGTATGPHGANTKFGLDPRFPRDWKFAIPAGMTGTTATNNNIVCAKCHNLNEVAGSTSPANVHRRSDHTGRPCVTCHTAIPHGSNRPRLLNDWNRDAIQYTGQNYAYAVGAASINILGAAPTRTNLSATQLTSTNFAWGSGSGATGNCTRGCGTHGSVSATQYVWE
jgi:cytochrome c2